MNWLWTHPFEGWGAVVDVVLAAVVLLAGVKLR